MEERRHEEHPGEHRGREEAESYNDISIGVIVGSTVQANHRWVCSGHRYSTTHALTRIAVEIAASTRVNGKIRSSRTERHRTEKALVKLTAEGDDLLLELDQELVGAGAMIRTRTPILQHKDSDLLVVRICLVAACTPCVPQVGPEKKGRPKGGIQARLR